MDKTDNTGVEVPSNIFLSNSPQEALMNVEVAHCHPQPTSTPLAHSD